jgi:hypothetical protein
LHPLGPTIKFPASKYVCAETVWPAPGNYDPASQYRINGSAGGAKVECPAATLTGLGLL